MCGFIFGLKENVTKDVKLNEILHHRGPDGFEYIHKDDYFLSHNRLSIIDVSNGTQPLISTTQKEVIIFNGEVYNFRAIVEAEDWVSASAEREEDDAAGPHVDCRGLRVVVEESLWWHVALRASPVFDLKILLQVSDPLDCRVFLMLEWHVVGVDLQLGQAEVD